MGSLVEEYKGEQNLQIFKYFLGFLLLFYAIRLILSCFSEKFNNSKHDIQIQACSKYVDMLHNEHFKCLHYF
jgi:hypothetical protein